MNKILLIHTGGTIGMVPSVEGLVPQNGTLEAALRKMTPSNVVIDIHTFDPLVDSAEVGPSDWNKIIDIIADFDGTGVIITHGTDTMAFTGAALSQALLGLKIPVILCGSMRPLHMGGDAEGNLELALVASQSQSAGVWLAFAGNIMPAGALVKHHAHAHDSFKTVTQNTGSDAEQSAQVDFTPRKFSDLRLAILTLSPGLPASAIDAALQELDGAVLRVFGAGTCMSNPVLMEALTRAISRGVRIRAVSQCEQGGLDVGAYAAGAALWQTGVENGGTETAEFALTRLWLEMSET